MIEVLPNFPCNVIGLRCTDHNTRADYDKAVIPTAEAGLVQHQKLRMYVQMDSFAGMTPGALWEDTKVDLQLLTHWERVAVVTDLDWLSKATNLFTFLMRIPVRHFPLADAEQARACIVSSASPSS